MKANVKFWAESKSLDVSLYAENESELAMLHLLRDSVHEAAENRAAYVPLPFHFAVKVPSRERKGDSTPGMIWQSVQGRARLADIPLTGAWWGMQSRKETRPR